MPVQVRLRTPAGQTRLELEDTATYAHFLELVREKTGLKSFTLKYGYPLKDLKPSPDQLHSTVKQLKLHGETIVVAPVELAVPVPAPQPATPIEPAFVPKGVEPDETVVNWSDRGGGIWVRSSGSFMVLRRIPNHATQCSE